MAHQQSFSPEIAAPSVGTKAEPLVAGNGGNGGSGGIAAVETDVGDVECLLYPRSRAQRGQTKLSENTDDATTRANPARGRPKAQSARGGRASTPGNCPSGKAATARARQPDDDGVKSGGDVGEDDGDNIGDRGGVDRSTTTAPKRLSTERSQQMYDVYRQTQGKLQVMRDEGATSGCTFAPKLASKQHGRKLEEGSAYDHLYQESLKQRERREKMVQEESLKLSFQPVLPTASSRMMSKAKRTSAGTEGHQRAEDKTKATEEIMYRECTFTPNTEKSRVANSKVTTDRENTSKPLVERLYVSPDAQAAVRKSRELARESLEMGACTFRPTTTKFKSSSGDERGSSGGTCERLFGKHGEQLTKKETIREELAAKEMMECPFSPILVAKRPVGEIASDDYATMDGKAQPVHDRLYNARGRTQTREAFVDPECTFQPRIIGKSFSPNSRDKALPPGKESSLEATGVSRMETMYDHGKQRQRARSTSPRNYSETFRKRDEDEEMELCTFQPNVSITDGSPFKKEPRDQPLFKALYAKREDIETTRLRVRQEIMKECTFSPELSSFKTRIGRSMSPQRNGPIFENLYSEAAAQRLARTLSVDKIQAKECPFKPELVSRSRDGRTSSGGNKSVGHGKNAFSVTKPATSNIVEDNTGPAKSSQRQHPSKQQQQQLGHRQKGQERFDGRPEGAVATAHMVHKECRNIGTGGEGTSRAAPLPPPPKDAHTMSEARETYAGSGRLETSPRCVPGAPAVPQKMTNVEVSHGVGTPGPRGKLGATETLDGAGKSAIPPTHDERNFVGKHGRATSSTKEAGNKKGGREREGIGGGGKTTGAPKSPTIEFSMASPSAAGSVGWRASGGVTATVDNNQAESEASCPVSDTDHTTRSSASRTEFQENESLETQQKEQGITTNVPGEGQTSVATGERAETDPQAEGESGKSPRKKGKKKGKKQEGSGGDGGDGDANSPGEEDFEK